jgi:tetratricopeptide (TPR) repeat protein
VQHARALEDELVRLAPERFDTWFELALSGFHRGENGLAEKHIDRARRCLGEMDTADLPNWKRLYRLQIDYGLVEASLATIVICYRLARDDWWCMSSIAGIAGRLRPEIIDLDPLFEQLSSGNSNDPTYWYQLAKWCENSRRDEQARQALERCFALDPKHYEAREIERRLDFVAAHAKSRLAGKEQNATQRSRFRIWPFSRLRRVAGRPDGHLPR